MKDMKMKYSSSLNKIIDRSRAEAARLNSSQVETAHLLLALLEMNDCNSVTLLKQQGASVETLRKQSEEWILGHVPENIGSQLTVSRRVEKVLRAAMVESMNGHSEETTTRHLLLAMMKEQDNEVRSLLEQNHVSYLKTKQLIESSGRTNQENDQQANNDGQEYPNHITGNSQSLPTSTRSTIGSQAHTSQQDDETGNENDNGGEFPKIKTTRKDSNSATPTLDCYGHDITRAARKGLLDPVIGRENEITRLSQILGRRKKNNPILIGQPGVGKSAIVEGLATRIVERRVSRLLFNKRIVTLDLAAVVAGTQYRGQFEERVRNIIKEVEAQKDIILFIDEIHTIIGAGGAAGTMDAANILKPALARGGMQCIGATTIDEYRKSIEKDGGLERRFQKVTVEPTSKEETLQILRNLRERYEAHHHVKYSDAALEACVMLSDRYVNNRCFPDKAIDAMDESGAKVRIKTLPENKRLTELEKELEHVNKLKNEAVKEHNFTLAGELRGQAIEIARQIDDERKCWEKDLDEEKMTVDEADVADVVAQMTGIPVQRIDQNETQRLRTMRNVLAQAVVGQDDAINSVVRAIQRSRVGLKNPEKPIGTFMFLGPTGVGKTYLTQQLAEVMFGSKDALVRIDMSEFGEKHTVSRLLGAPPGYVGYENGGQLTEQVRRKPYSIVLLDEIEKAHVDVFNVLLQVMDEGRLTDGNGSTVSFKNTIIIMTSNCGTRQLKEFGNGIGFGAGNAVIDNQSGREVIQKALNKQFAPEFLNRLDEIVFFNQLDKDSILRMVDLKLKPVIERVATIGYKLNVDAEVKDLLAEKGYDTQYGARPLARAIQTHLEDAICEVLMNEEPDKEKELMAVVESGKVRIKF